MYDFFDRTFIFGPLRVNRCRREISCVEGNKRKKMYLYLWLVLLFREQLMSTGRSNQTLVKHSSKFERIITQKMPHTQSDADADASVGGWRLQIGLTCFCIWLRQLQWVEMNVHCFSKNRHRGRRWGKEEISVIFNSGGFRRGLANKRLTCEMKITNWIKGWQ